MTDTAAILNGAFRALIGGTKGTVYNDDYLPEVADFDWLLRNEHIEFASRDDYNGSFTDLWEDFHEKKKNIDLPEKEYAQEIDKIYQDKYVHKYNIDEATRKFTYKFRDRIKKELEDIKTFPEISKTLQDLTYILSNEETLAYNSVKNVMKDKLELEEKDPRYQHVRGILRQSYDYNIPELLGLDYCRSLWGITPLRKQDWRLELDCEKTLEFDFDCSIYGLAALPARYLIDIWKIAKLKLRARQYIYSDSPYIVLAKMLKDAYNKCCDICDIWNMGDIKHAFDWRSPIVKVIVNKVFPSVAKKIDGFPAPPEEMNEAVIMKSKTESGIHDVNVKPSV